MFWFPLSCGIMDGIKYYIFASVRIQHLFMFLPLGVVFIWVFQDYKKRGSFRVDPFFLTYTILIILSALLFSNSFNFLFSLLALWGLYFFAQTIVENITFEYFAQLLYYSALFFVVLSWLYIILNYDMSANILQSKLVVSSFYNHKNSYGLFLMFSILIIALHILYTKIRFGDLTVLILAIIALYFSGSRTAMALTLVALFFLFAIYFRFF